MANANNIAEWIEIGKVFLRHELTDDGTLTGAVRPCDDHDTAALVIHEPFGSGASRLYSAGRRAR